MQKSIRARPLSTAIGIVTLELALLGMPGSFGQSLTSATQNSVSPQRSATEPATSLATLIQEVEQNNPQIVAAKHAWHAAMQIPSQVSTLPDPQFTIQQFAVGNPAPFAGYTTSNFAYIGFGVSQDLPYPGKRRLRGEAAQRDAEVARDRIESTQRSLIEQLKTAYFQLSYEYQELALLDRDGKLLDQVAKIAEANYRVGKGNQQDVLKAQLEKTKLLIDLEMHHQQHRSLQAKLKQLLNRSSNQADVVPQVLTETPLRVGVDDLLGEIRSQNPDIQGQQETIQSKSLQLEIAHKDFYPDFNFQYMWQHTAPQYPDYYMLSVGVKVPIHRSRKQWPEVEQAAEELNRSRRDYEGQIQQAYFDIRDQYLKAESAARVLSIYRQGLIPQAANTFKAGLAAYEVNREDFETLLNSFLDVLRLDEAYWRNLLEHEMALATLEQITGRPLGTER